MQDLESTKLGGEEGLGHLGDVFLYVIAEVQALSIYIRNKAGSRIDRAGWQKRAGTLRRSVPSFDH